MKSHFFSQFLDIDYIKNQWNYSQFFGEKIWSDGSRSHRRLGTANHDPDDEGPRPSALQRRVSLGDMESECLGCHLALVDTIVDWL